MPLRHRSAIIVQMRGTIHCVTREIPERNHNA